MMGRCRGRQPTARPIAESQGSGCSCSTSVNGLSGSRAGTTYVAGKRDGAACVAAADFCERSGIGPRAGHAKNRKDARRPPVCGDRPNPRFRKCLQGAQNRRRRLHLREPRPGAPAKATPGRGGSKPRPVRVEARPRPWRNIVSLAMRGIPGSGETVRPRTRRSGAATYIFTPISHTNVNGILGTGAHLPSVPARRAACGSLGARPLGRTLPSVPPLTAALFPARRSSFRTATAQGPRTSVRGPRIVTNYPQPRLTGPAYRRGCRACRRNGR